MSKKSRWIFTGVIVLQLVLLLGMMGYKEATLRFGETVILQAVPVDPRDLFRGEYVVLRYKISRLEREDALRIRNAYLDKGDTVYVHLEQRGDVWAATGISNKPQADWDVFIKGGVEQVSGSYVYGSDWRMDVKYGIESYFVPEGRGHEIERARDVKVKVSVDGFGRSVIKGLIVDGADWDPHLSSNGR